MTRPSTGRIALALGGVLVAQFLYVFFLCGAMKLTPFLPLAYPSGIVLVDAQPLWRWLLPQPELSGAWSSTGLLFFHVLETHIGTGLAFCLGNALAVSALFFAVLHVFSSLRFAAFAAFALAFSTHNFHVYQLSGSAILGFVAAYCIAALYLQWRALHAGNFALSVAAYLAALLFLALSYEGWLDYLAWLGLVTPFAYWGLRQRGQSETARRLVVTSGIALAIGILYVVTKVTGGYGQQAGSESDLVVNYRKFWPIAETIFGNGLKNLYLAAMNFFPPELGSSMTMQNYGGQWAVDQQAHYHPEFRHLAYYDVLFFWRYFAGMLFAAAVYAGFRLGRVVFCAPFRSEFAWPLLFLSMMLFGGSTHALVKFRPFNAMPFLGYHVWFGILGTTLLFGWLVDRYGSQRTRISRAVLAGAYVLVLWSAFGRPRLLNASIREVKMGEYPSPGARLQKALRGR